MSDSSETSFTVREQAKDLVMWKDPKTSGMAFVVGNLFVYLLAFGGYTVMTLVAYIALLHMVFRMFVSQAMGVMCELTNAPKPEQKVATGPLLSEEAIATYVPLVVNTINRCYATIYETENMALKIKAILITYAFSILGKWFSLLTLTYLVFLAAFTLPTVYTQKQKEIDALIAKGKVAVNEAISQASSKIQAKMPPKKAQAKKE